MRLIKSFFFILFKFLFFIRFINKIMIFFMHVLLFDCYKDESFINLKKFTIL
jgi:hypothetical protein